MKAFKTFSQCPDKPLNIPNEWPWQVQECDESETFLLQNQEFTVMSDSEYQSYLQNHQAAYDDWLMTVPKKIAPVTNQQLRSALVLTSFSQNKPNLHPEAIKLFIETLPEPNRSLALQQWEYSNEMLRNNPLINSMASALGLTSQDLDNLWLYAATLII